MNVRHHTPAELLQQTHARRFRAGGAHEAHGIAASQPIPTETAVAVFSILTGVGSAVSNVVAAHRLSTLSSDSIAMSNLAMPVGLIMAGAVAGAFLVPGGGDIIPGGVPTAAPADGHSAFDHVGARRFDHP